MIFVKVNGSHLSNTQPREMKDVSPEEFLPTKQDLNIVEKEFIILAARVLVKYIPSMEFFKDVVVHHIDHQYSEEMAKISEQVCALELLCNVMGNYVLGFYYILFYFYINSSKILFLSQSLYIEYI